MPSPFAGFGRFAFVAILTTSVALPAPPVAAAPAMQASANFSNLRNFSVRLDAVDYGRS